MINSINNISLGEVIPSKVTGRQYVVRKINADGIIFLSPINAVSRRESIFIDNLIDWKMQAENKENEQQGLQ
jgi:hypothetical protein